MAVYCLPIQDELLVNETRDAPRILLVGCPSCANVSYSYHRDFELPVVRMTLGGIKAMCVRRESRRLADLLKFEHNDVTVWVPNYPAALCALELRDRKKLFERAQASDVIVTLSCESGTKNVEEMIPGKKVVGAMRARGVMRGIIERKWASYHLDKKSVRILPFAVEPG